MLASLENQSTIYDFRRECSLSNAHLIDCAHTRSLTACFRSSGSVNNADYWNRASLCDSFSPLETIQAPFQDFAVIALKYLTKLSLKFSQYGFLVGMRGQIFVAAFKSTVLRHTASCQVEQSSCILILILLTVNICAVRDFVKSTLKLLATVPSQLIILSCAQRFGVEVVPLQNIVLAKLFCHPPYRRAGIR